MPGRPQARGRPGPRRQGSVADVTFRTLDGREKKISDYGRKILVVNYMATWNEDSRKLVPIMNEVQRKFHLNVTVIGVLTDLKDSARVNSFIKTNDVKFEVLLPGGDPGRFGRPRKLPTSHIVTRDDYLLTTFAGLFRADKYEDMILAMYRRRM
jgi:cytochrome c biogenesis protein CcmG/thiol:disulfide interchange protein DsbE